MRDLAALERPPKHEKAMPFVASRLGGYGLPVTDCFACEGGREPVDVAERILVQDGWRVAHALGTSLPGWLVALPLRHVTSVEELTPDEAAAMGVVIQRCARALKTLTGCQKSYFMFFAEAEGFAHLHVRVVPRMNWFDQQQADPRVFSLLGVDESASLSHIERQAVSSALKGVLRDQG